MHSFKLSSSEVAIVSGLERSERTTDVGGDGRMGELHVQEEPLPNGREFALLDLCSASGCPKLEFACCMHNAQG